MVGRPPLVKNVLQRIYNVEGFEVKIYDRKRNELDPNYTMPKMYPIGNKSRNKWTVATWESRKFRKHFPRYWADVLNGQGDVVRGNTTLANVRDSYIEEED